MVLVTDRPPRRNDAPPGLGQGLRCVSRAHRHDHRCQTKGAVQRWQEAKPLHETGVVSRIPRSARRTQVLETDNNTERSAAHTDYGRNEQEQGMRNLNYEL